jgi:caffeoyl-CoA O-methyltransferase
MEFIPKEIEEYAVRFSKPEAELLYELYRETHLKVMSPRMLSGHLQGSFLTMVSNMIRPSRVLEIGTYTGYSAICLAKGLHESGILTTIDANPEIESMARKYFRESGMDHKIEFTIGDAMKIIPTLNGSFDLVFIDADKKNYGAYYDLVFEKVSPGGFILADNVLWSGKITMDESKMDADTKAIHEFNRKVNLDERVENMILPIRDGIMMVRKKGVLPGNVVEQKAPETF